MVDRGKTVILTGATGMVGGEVLELCLASDQVAKVVSLTRRPTGKTHAKLDEIAVDNFLEPRIEQDYLETVDIVFYCLGTYSNQVSKEQFYDITVSYPEVLAQTILNAGRTPIFCLLSGAGTDRSEKSMTQFAKLKGMIENKLSRMSFARFHTFRPAYIYPVKPRNEPSFLYTVLRFLYPLIKLFGSSASISSQDLALAMFTVATEGGDQEIYENAEMGRIAQKARTVEGSR